MSLAIEIIGIGNELITGRIPDENARYAARRLSSLGFKVARIVFIGDQAQVIQSTLKRARKRADIVLVTGGLGATLDDITVQVVSRTFNRPLVPHQGLEDQIKRFLEKKAIPWDTAFEKLTLLPEGAELLHPRPKACGFSLEEDGKLFFFLPGITAEMRRLMDRHIIPYLIQKDPGQEVVRQRIYKIFGLQEPEINERVRDLEGKYQAVQLGFYPNFPENHLTVMVRSDKTLRAERVLDKLEEAIEERLGAYIVAKGEKTLEEVVGELLKERKNTLSIAESCTGGLIGHRITNVPGSSEYFERGVIAYSNQAKMELLGVPKSVLRDFGAVSRETALQMARGIRRQSRSSLGLSVTGIAGPGGGTPEKPVGTVWIGLASPDGEASQKYLFNGRREQIKSLAATTALDWVRRYLIDDSFLFSH